jgi:tRNA (guanine-N7-)-methyltransferase
LNPPSTSDGNAAERIHFYGRRKGKALNVGRRSLLDTLLPDVRISVPGTDGSVPGTDQIIDPHTFFPKAPSGVRMEIGFGSGEHLAAQAKDNPDIGFIGCEVFLNGVASLLRYVAQDNLTNVRIFDNDVRHLLPRIQSASLTRVSLLFPDPWPKTRHAKRRFVSPAMLDEMARLLVDGGELRVASDHPVYQEWTLLHATVHPAFRWQARRPDDWRTRPDDSIATRYEEKALAAGRTPVFMNFTRAPRGA